MNRPERIDESSLIAAMRELGQRAKEAARELALASTDAKNTALTAAAAAMRRSTESILTANTRDIEAAQARGVTGAFLDRLLLNEKRISATADG
jgi:glutamate-5-semialdehyde dehydrogenase